VIEAFTADHWGTTQRKDACDPFNDSAEAVDDFKNGNWLPLLKHNFVDIHHARELADLAGRFIPKSDFSMKNLDHLNSEEHESDK